ncbi:MBL fold metallo-hydrolase [Myxococcota bacterium]|nr:MBL fold metallo-hydrolase [Myxococcota bacterium]
MQLHHLRNATAILQLGPHRLLIDPMLSAPGVMPGFKLFGGGRRRNPLVALPAGAEAALQDVSGVIITHEHPDHLDGPGVAWLKARGLPVWAAPTDAAALRGRGLEAEPWTDGALGLDVELIPGQHGQGALAWWMGPVAGVYLAHPDEPSVYLTSDTVLSPGVREAITRMRPDVIVAPAGAANMGLGGDILFSMDELVALAKLAPGLVIFNHLEALDHCPTTRDALRARLAAEGLAERCRVPEDGEVVHHQSRAPDRPGSRGVPKLTPGLQKWVTGRLGR